MISEVTDSYHTSPSCLRESLALEEAVAAAAQAAGVKVLKFQPKLPEFIELVASGWVKWEWVHRHDEHPPTVSQPCSGYTTTVHGMISPTGEIAWVKIKDDDGRNALSRRRSSLRWRCG